MFKQDRLSRIFQPREAEALSPAINVNCLTSTIPAMCVGYKTLASLHQSHVPYHTETAVEHPNTF